jgi:hypothetical protein
LLRDIHAEFGWKSRIFSSIGGLYTRWKIRQEEKRLAAGWTYEPTTWYERNAAVTDRPEAALGRYATPRASVPSTPMPITDLVTLDEPAMV